MKYKRFEDLPVWNDAIDLAVQMYALTGKPQFNSQPSLKDQLERAAVSVSNNIAEGFERVHLPEKLQFYNVARGSTAEVRSLLYVIEDNFPHSASDAAALRGEVVSVGKLVTGLIRSTEGRKVHRALS